MSRKSSALSVSGLSMEKTWIFPGPSATIIRLVSGSWAMQTGLWNLSRSKPRLSRYGRGGSGEPTIFELVQGTRFESPKGFSGALRSSPKRAGTPRACATTHRPVIHRARLRMKLSFSLSWARARDYYNAGSKHPAGDPIRVTAVAAGAIQEYGISHR